MTIAACRTSIANTYWLIDWFIYLFIYLFAYQYKCKTGQYNTNIWSGQQDKLMLRVLTCVSAYVIRPMLSREMRQTVYCADIKFITKVTNASHNQSINQSINLFANCATDTIKQWNDSNVAQRRATRKANAHLSWCPNRYQYQINHTTGDRQADKKTDKRTGFTYRTVEHWRVE